MCSKEERDFESLVLHIQTVDEALQRDARLVINRNVTTRAWLTGLYIVEYEQNGRDRAKYGAHLLQDLSKRLGGKSYSVTNLQNYRLFYQYYPELLLAIGDYLIERFGKDNVLSNGAEILPAQIQQTLSAKLLAVSKRQTLSVISANTEETLGVTGMSRDGFAMSLSDGSVKAVPQMNLYMEYYRQHYMEPDDNPPVGLLLCTKYGQELVKYMAPFTDPQLFVAQYELKLPSQEQIKEFLLKENTGN